MILIMEIEVKSLEEMPGALSYLIKSVEELKRTVNVLQTKQENNKPKWIWMNFALICLHIQPSRLSMDGFLPNRYLYIR